MRTTITTLLALATLSICFTASAAEPGSPDAAATPSSAAALTSTAKGLQNVHGGLTAQGASEAGRGREVDVQNTVVTGAKQARPAPTPRALRKMNADRAIAAVDPGIRACATDNASASAVSFSLRVSVAPNGDVESSEATAVAPALLQCVTKAVASAKFGAPGPQGAAIVVPVTVPAHAAVPTGMADAAKPAEAPKAAVASK